MDKLPLHWDELSELVQDTLEADGYGPKSYPRLRQQYLDEKPDRYTFLQFACKCTDLHYGAWPGHDHAEESTIAELRTELLYAMLNEETGKHPMLYEFAAAHNLDWNAEHDIRAIRGHYPEHLIRFVLELDHDDVQP